MTLSDELKQEVGREVTGAILQYTLVVFIANLCFHILLACPEPAICRSKLCRRLIGFKSLLICHWVTSACALIYFGIIEPLTEEKLADPQKEVSYQRTRKFIVGYLILCLVYLPWAYNYLRKRGWFKDYDEDTLGDKEGKEEGKASDDDVQEEDKLSDKEDDYVLPAGVRKRKQ